MWNWSFKSQITKSHLQAEFSQRMRQKREMASFIYSFVCKYFSIFLAKIGRKKTEKSWKIVNFSTKLAKALTKWKSNFAIIILPHFGKKSAFIHWAKAQLILWLVPNLLFYPPPYGLNWPNTIWSTREIYKNQGFWQCYKNLLSRPALYALFPWY